MIILLLLLFLLLLFVCLLIIIVLEICMAERSQIALKQIRDGK
jgi:hypothetical protein